MAALLSAGRDATINFNFGQVLRESEERSEDRLPEHSTDDLEAASADLFMWPQDIEGHVIDRPELALIEERLTAPTESIAPNRTILLFGEPGAGKSALLAALSERLISAGAVVLGIKADMLPPDVGSLADVGRALGLGDELAQELRSQGAIAPLFVLIDQLDAVAALIDGSGGRLRALSQLVRRLRLTPGIRMVVSARPFEFNADAAFRAAFPSNAVDVVELALPTPAAVDDALRRVGIDPSEIPDNLREIIRIPQALRDIVSARRAGFAWSAMTNWRQAQTVRFDRLVEQHPQLDLARVVEHLIHAQRRTGALWTAEAILPLGSRRAIERLRAEGILRQRDGTGLLGFAHQTWAETLDARLALAQGDLSERVSAAGHNLLARPQALAMLRYVRDAAQGEYDAAIARIWADPALKRHLRHLILDLAAGHEEPTPEERRLVTQIVTGDDAPLVERALRLSAGKPRWFLLLRGAVSDRMVSKDVERAWSVLHWLAAAASHFSLDVLALLQRNWLDSSDRLKFAPFVLERLGQWDERAFGMFEAAVAQAEGITFSHIAVVRRHAEDGRHDVAARLLGILWDRLVVLAQAAVREKGDRQEEQNTTDEIDLVARMRRLQRNKERSFAHHFSKLIRGILGLHNFSQFTKTAPKSYIRVLVPKLVSLAGEANLDRESRLATSYDYWELQNLGRNRDGSQGHFEVDLIESVRVALEELARISPSDLISTINSSKGNLILLDRLFALAISANTPALANAGLAFLEASADRLALGDRHGDDQADTVRLIESISSYLSTAENEKLIGLIKIWDYHLSDNSDDVHDRKRVRHANRRMRARLLAKIDRSQLWATAKRFIDEEMRAVPDAHRAPGRGIVSGYVRSPMAADAMERASDRNILNLFSELPDTTHGEHPRRNFSLVGGSREASSVFAELAKRQPDRVLRLLDQFSPDTHQRPVGEAVRALAEIESVDPQLLLVVLETALNRGFGNDEFLRDATFALDSLALRLTGLDGHWVERLISWLKQPKCSSDTTNTNVILDSSKADKPLPTSVLFGHGSMKFIAASNNYMIMRAVTHALLRREQPAYLEWLNFLEWRTSQPEDDAVWEEMCRHLIYISNVEPSRAAQLLMTIFQKWPNVRDSDEGAILIAQLFRVLPTETVDAVLAGWRGSNWPLASIAIGEISALRAAWIGPSFSVEGRLGSLGETGVDQDILAGIANLAVEYWNDDNSIRRSWARKTLAPLAARTEPRIAQVCASIFHRVAPWPQEDDTKHLLQTLSRNMTALQHVSDTAVDDRLGDLVDNASFHEIILDTIDGLIQANRRDLNDIRTAGPLLVQGLLPIVITIHRDHALKEESLILFEELIDINQGSVEEFLSRMNENAA